MFQGIHHIAIISSNYAVTCRFYVEVLGLAIVSEVYRTERQSHKLNLRLADGVELEIFSFPNPPSRLTNPEACGLRHLALSVKNLDVAIAHLNAHGIAVEPVRIDEYTDRRFTFFKDPDGLPIELYEVS